MYLEMEAALHKMKMKFLCVVEFDDRTQIGAAGAGTPLHLIAFSQPTQIFSPSMFELSPLIFLNFIK